MEFRKVIKKKKKINNNENLIRVLLTEVRELSEKQISLLDLMDDIQTTTQIKIEELNNRIITLEDTIKELNEQLYILQNEE
jgi:predicted  nucleic acid-binding Zn-ribbon protein